MKPGHLKAATTVAALILLFLAVVLYHSGERSTQEPDTGEFIEGDRPVSMEEPISTPIQPEAPEPDSEDSADREHIEQALQYQPGSGGNTGSLADMLEGVDLNDPEQRERVVRQMEQQENARRQAAIDYAERNDLPTRIEHPDGTVQEIVDIDDDGRPVYRTTHNVRASVSVAADQLLGPNYALNGYGVTIGMWDGGTARASHQEFDGGRMLVMDSSGAINHATHVGGTMIAAGVRADARGMAPAARVESYDWNNDKSQMLSRAASSEDDVDRLFLSNHSYGFIAGWSRTGQSSPAFIWYGGSEIDPRFGQYNVFARDSDAIAYAAPYYLMFRSAGNDRTENPQPGQAVRLSPSSSTTVAYDPAVHPAGDGVYRSGYNTISFDGLAKNVITIGSVSDAVTAGQRDITAAQVSAFSSWGPTDDGRIKPDLVANGESLLSTLNNSSSSYGSFSGTSMSSPNAAGAAALLIEKYSSLFPEQAMRAATLKGLLIHTADDIGPPGPDYQTGWGLLNVEAAAQMIRSHAEDPARQSITENRLDTENFIEVYEFVWDGVSPIRVTLAWTDPPGSATTGTDIRAPRLRNNLDVRVVDPEMQDHYPYVMPFVGTWTEESMSEPATTGINNTDNVEQVFIQSPEQEGVYRVIVSHQGSLQNDMQDYSLFISGASGDDPEPADLTVFGISPAVGAIGDRLTFNLSGLALSTVTDVRLTREGSELEDLIAEDLRMAGNQLRGLFDLAEASAGFWDVVVSNEENSVVLENAFEVVDTLLSQDFNTDFGDWVFAQVRGSNQWFVTNADAHSPPSSAFSPAPATATTTRLISPAVQIPTAASNLQLRFWHQFQFQPNQDGGRLYVSFNGGPWIGSDEPGSGLNVVSNDYNANIRRIGLPQSRSDFAGERAWSGDSGGFIETVVEIDEDVFADQSVRFAWTLATNGSIASPGWYVDSISLTTQAVQEFDPPIITTEPFVEGAETVDEEDVSWAIVSEADAVVSVGAEPSQGSQSLSFSWTGSGPAPVFFSPNNTAEASTSRVEFEAAGDYTISVNVTDNNGLSSLATTYIRVLPAASDIRVTPSSVTLTVWETQQFVATMLDQFDEPLPQQPEGFDWAATGGGSIDENGLFSATSVGDNFTISAIAEVIEAFAANNSEPVIESGLSNSALVNVSPVAATIRFLDLVQLFDGAPLLPIVLTEPPNLNVLLEFDGEESAPSDPGTYNVEANIDEQNFQGSETAVFTIRSPSEEPAGYSEWQENYFGPEAEDNPLAAPDVDADGDGLINLVEFYLGTDPTDPASRLKLTVEAIDLVERTVLLRLDPVVAEGAFRIEQSDTLFANNPHHTPLTVGPEDSWIEIELPIDEAAEFFRAVYSLPPE
ncbi:MAG: S8 family serine peptidase [Opitutales bacterium]|nr:S8 family serine peptidase [Opitutales bacterium]